MRTRLSCLLALMAALSFTAPAFAQSDMPTQTLGGVVVSSSNDSLVIRTDDGTERTFKVDAQTNLPSNLAQGTRVTVAYHRMDGGVDHAARVTTATADTRPRTGTEATGTPSTDRPATQDPGMGTTPSTDTATTGDQLPATAGPVPALFLAGLGALAAGLGLRRASRRS
jgi:hypothetical protein